MDERRLIYLAAGALRAEQAADVAACWRSAEGDTARGTLEDALAQARGDVHLVLSAGDALLTRVALSKRQGRHIQKVLPYLLEESVLGRNEELWYAHGKPLDDQYPVVACEQDGLTQLLDWCSEAAHVRIAGAWIDADLLRDQAPCMVPQQVLHGDMLDILCVPAPGQALVLPVAEAAALPTMMGLGEADFQHLDDPAQLFSHFARAISAGDRIVLLHGALRPNKGSAGMPQTMLAPWLPVARLSVVVLVCIWGLLLVQKWQYEAAAQEAAQASVALYQELFPSASRPQMIITEFETQINRLAGGAGGSGFLALMGPTGEIIGAAADQGVVPRRLQYDERDSVLLLDLNAQDFSVLESLREQLQSAGLSAEIGTARSQASGVTARMRVGQG
ncbi:hypothetical protein K8B33_02035 [Alcanivorax sp. JB21]|uniref:type II secretion system protein GspL n=1 Tax=Alcanivorax limicola TaxID=2874102 RepID=UPI001CBE2193|nr:type II secretion system protein GspL [Alcanivorax limicola]MBZ2187863.1 hypothetical protein [Alcanivorax limicola]